MSVASNSSPLINLARIGLLDLLRKLYGELIVPEAVWHEVVVQGAGQIGAQEIETASWVEMQLVSNRELVRAPQHALNAGEAEAIVLTLEIDAEFLLMDERLGRETASHMGVRCVGLIGALIEAKRRLIEQTRPVLDRLRDLAGFRVSQALHQRVLQDEGELA
jgi:predicted nucleic acid-binding protein